MNDSIRSVSIPVGEQAVDVAVAERGAGRPVLLLHGGAGPQSVTGFAGALAERGAFRVLTPTHPGFAGTGRPDRLAGVGALAGLHRGLLEGLDLTDVTVVGFSIGGWLAAELTLAAPGRVGRLVLVDAIGIQVEGHPVADIFPLSLPEIAALSYHDPERFVIDPAALTDEQRAVTAGNRAALAAYGGASMADPALRERLAAVTQPTLVVWGDSDGIADPDYGRAYAAAIPGARFELLAACGHVPQIERPDALLDLVAAFAATPSQPARR